MEIDENALPLEEFIKLPSTIDFNVINTERFKLYVKDKPYIKLGTEFGNEYIVAYTNKDNIAKIFIDLGYDFVDFFPKILSPLDYKSNEVSGITQILNQPTLNLSGRGVIIGFVDTGIDYTKDAFKFEDGTTKIISIWDQTLDGDRPESLHFGSVYSSDQINEALKSETPFDIVPTIDNDGHGTFLASVAASNEKNQYIGAAPKAYIVSVKLRRANQFYINMYLLDNENHNLFESTDYLLGMKYIFDKSDELDLPIVMCIGMGSNTSGHDGNTFFEDYISFVSQRAGYAVVTAAGNESNAKHHTQGNISKTGSTDTISIKNGRSGTSFSLFVFAPAFDKISASITSPTGEVITRVPFGVGHKYRQKLLFESTTVSIEYYKDSNMVIFIRFQDATQGIWDITLYGDAIVSGYYYAWLPISGQIDPSVEFLRPIPEYTIVYPATSLRTITCGAYNSADNSLFVSSSWGPTRLPRPAPDFVAPGVNIRGVFPTGVGTMTGTSVSAAVTAGAVALLLEWGIVHGNVVSMDGSFIRTLLISGCERDEGVLYPNNKWGYGRLNLYNTFSTIKETNIEYNIEE